MLYTVKVIYPNADHPEVFLNVSEIKVYSNCVSMQIKPSEFYTERVVRENVSAVDIMVNK